MCWSVGCMLLLQQKPSTWLGSQVLASDRSFFDDEAEPRLSYVVGKPESIHT